MPASEARREDGSSNNQLKCGEEIPRNWVQTVSQVLTNGLEKRLDDRSQYLCLCVSQRKPNAARAAARAAAAAAAAYGYAGREGVS